MMKAFVTGVGGQLGYDVVNELKKRGYVPEADRTNRQRVVDMFPQTGMYYVTAKSFPRAMWRRCV